MAGKTVKPALLVIVCFPFDLTAVMSEAKAKNTYFALKKSCTVRTPWYNQTNQIKHGQKQKGKNYGVFQPH